MYSPVLTSQKKKILFFLTINNYNKATRFCQGFRRKKTSYFLPNLFENTLFLLLILNLIYSIAREKDIVKSFFIKNEEKRENFSLFFYNIEICVF